MIPGPSFVLVARNSIGLSRRDGLATAIGMGVGGTVFCGVALAGFYTLLHAVEWLYVSLKVAGGAYLIYMASKIWRGASCPIAMDATLAIDGRSTTNAFWSGLTTELSNPKTAIWYASIFAALLPQRPPMWCYLALPPLVFCVGFGWYAIVALCLSTRRPRELYIRAKKWVDFMAAGTIALLGLRLVLNAPKSGI